MVRSENRVTALLAKAGSGSPDEQEELWRAIYDELREMARRKAGQERPGATLQATALVHEAYLRLVSDDSDWDSRAHFFGAAARAMRQVLVDSARRSGAEKRGGGRQRFELDPAIAALTPNSESSEPLAEALHEFEQKHPRSARVVDLRFFAGLNVSDTALALEISQPTVVREWRFARAWLKRQLSNETS